MRTRCCGKYGNEHPDVASCLAWQSTLEFAQTNYDQSLALSKRQLAINEKPSGQQVPLLSALNGLGLMYVHQRRLPEVELLLKRMLSIAETTFAEGEPKLAISLYNLATVYQLQNNYSASNVCGAKRFRAGRYDAAIHSCRR